MHLCIHATNNERENEQSIFHFLSSVVTILLQRHVAHIRVGQCSRQCTVLSTGVVMATVDVMVIMALLS